MFSIRPMRRDDLRFTFAASLEEGWNIGRHDHDVFFAADPNGFFVGEVKDENGVTPVGSVSGVAYGTAFGFMGIYIVRPAFRGKGYGLRLFETALNGLRQRGVACIGLDGVLEQQANYRKIGFQTAYRNIRYGGVGLAADDGRASQARCVPLDTVPFAELEAFDLRHFPAPRPAFLRGWYRQPESTALGVIADGRLIGCGMIRPSTAGHLIAPLFADSEAIAETLFTALASQRPGEPIFLDIPEPNRAGIALAERHGLTPVFETARMYTGEPPNLPLNAIYGVTSLELG